MKKFIAIYMADLEQLDIWKAYSAEERLKGLNEWIAWSNAHIDHLTDMGHALGHAIKIYPEHVEHSRNQMCAYSMVQAESEEEAIKLFEDHPHMEDGKVWIELLECRDV